MDGRLKKAYKYYMKFQKIQSIYSAPPQKKSNKKNIYKHFLSGHVIFSVIQKIPISANTDVTISLK